MNTTTAATPALSVVPATRGFASLDCISCGAQGNVTVNLGDVLSFTCTECENEFTADAVRDLIGRWTRALAWLETAPVTDGE